MSRKLNPDRRHALNMKRSNFLKQACIEWMRKRHPEEYNQLLKETASLFPQNAKPRYVDGFDREESREVA